jgi:hypothetical protein
MRPGIFFSSNPLKFRGNDFRLNFYVPECYIYFIFNEFKEFSFFLFFLKVTSETDQADFYRSNADRLQGFKPFDLEGWWGRRVVQNLSISRGNP